MEKATGRLATTKEEMQKAKEACKIIKEEENKIETEAMRMRTRPG